MKTKELSVKKKKPVCLCVKGKAKKLLMHWNHNKK